MGQASQRKNWTSLEGSSIDLAVSKTRIPFLADMHTRALPFCFTEFSMFGYTDVLVLNARKNIALLITTSSRQQSSPANYVNPGLIHGQQIIFEEEWSSDFDSSYLPDWADRRLQYSFQPTIPPAMSPFCFAAWS